jgi:glyoxylate reductase
VGRQGRAGTMPYRKPVVIVTRRLPALVEHRMGELFDARFNAEDRAMDAAALASAAGEADVLVPTVTDRIDAAVIAAAGPRLKLIANFGNGVDNIDVKAAYARGITVTNTPGVLTEDMADFTMALIVAVSRRFIDGAKALTGGQFAGWSPSWMLGQRISASASASSDSGASGGRWRSGRAPSGSRSTITTAGRPRRGSNRNSMRPTGTASTA